MKEFTLLGPIYGGSALFCHSIGALWYTGIGFAMVVHGVLIARRRR